ncbi:hypothetical protein [Streptomyces sp. NPDC001774]
MRMFDLRLDPRETGSPATLLQQGIVSDGSAGTMDMFLVSRKAPARYEPGLF